MTLVALDSVSKSTLILVSSKFFFFAVNLAYIGALF